jgi:hypothetical protein
VSVAQSISRSGRSLSASASASQRISRPSASVLPISTVLPAARANDVARPDGVARDGILDGRNQHAKANRRGRGHERGCEPEHDGCAAHVFLHFEHRLARLEIEAARIEADALADERDLRRGLVAPAQIDQAGRAIARPSHKVNGRVVVAEQIVACDHVRCRAVGMRCAARGLGEMLGAHVLRRRVDQVTREKHALREALDLGPVGVLRPRERRRCALRLLVLREGVGTERPAERDVGGGCSILGVEHVLPLGQCHWQVGERVDRGTFGRRRNHGRRTAVGAGQERERARVRLEADRGDPFA